METVRTVVESFIRLIKVEVHPGAVLVASDDVFEVKNVPSVVLQGPTLVEDGDRRTQGKQVYRDVNRLTYEECKSPRLYHLDFDVIVTTGNELALLDLQEKVARFYQLHPILTIADRGSLNVTELIPLGGLKRVNLSNLRQSSGRCRIEDCPIYDGLIQGGKLVKDFRLQFVGGVSEDITITP